MSDLAAAHRQLQDAVQSDDTARTAHKELERRYRASQQRAKKAQEAVTQALERLSKANVTFLGLQKTQVGVDVNKLRKHEVTSVQVAADKLVRSWKSVVEQHQHHHIQPTARAAPRPASAAAAGGSAHRPAEGRGVREVRATQVLDSVRDENGRVERRGAHPDSHEDQLALREAEEAERMWDAQMGGGSGGGGGRGGGSGSRGGGGSGGGSGSRGRWTASSDEEAEAEEAPHASRAGGAPSRPSAQEQRRQVAGAQLKQRYEQIERAKKSRQLVSLETAEVPKKEKRKAEASAGGSLRAKLG